ncbi:MAG TPA: hypothetical protein VI197_00435 [Polyangiaceae bacterium]
MGSLPACFGAAHGYDGAHGLVSAIRYLLDNALSLRIRFLLSIVRSDGLSGLLVVLGAPTVEFLICSR